MPRAQVDRVDVETAALADAQARAVEQLEQRDVPPDTRVGVAVGLTAVERGGPIEHRDRVVPARDTRQLLRPAGGVEPRGDVAGDDAVTPRNRTYACTDAALRETLAFPNPRVCRYEK